MLYIWGLLTPKISCPTRLLIVPAASTLRDVQILLLLNLIWKDSNNFSNKSSFFKCCPKIVSILDEIFMIQDRCGKKQYIFYISAG